MKKSLNTFQSLTAYKLFIRARRTADVQTISSGESEGVDLRFLLDDFFESSVLDRKSAELSKALKGDAPILDTLDNGHKRIHTTINSGVYGRKATLYDLENETTEDVAPNKAVCHLYHVFFYYKDLSNSGICIFHRYGTGGCKTVFLQLFNKYLENYELIADLIPVMDPNANRRRFECEKNKLRFIKTAPVNTEKRDVTDRIRKPLARVRNIEYEVCFDLHNFGWDGFLYDISEALNGRKKIREIIANKIAAFSSSIGDCDRALMDIEEDGRKFTIDLDDKESIDNHFAAHNITDTLEYDENREPTYESVQNAADAYYYTII